MKPDERIEFAKQNGMSLAFVNWFFDEQKEQSGFIAAEMMWKAWKAGEAHNNKAVLRSMGIK